MPDISQLQPTLSGSVAQSGVADISGTIQYQSGSTSESAGDVAFAGPIADFILYGVVNGAFAQGPPDSTQNIDPINNPLPYWTGPTSVSGGAITWSWVDDAASPSGKNLRASINPGAAGDEAYFEQIVPVGGLRSRKYSLSVIASVYRVTASGGAPLFTLELQALTAAGATTGSASTSTESLSADATLYYESAQIGPSPAADATLMRIRIGVRRDTMAANDTATVDITDVREVRGMPYAHIADISTPSTYYPAIIYQTNGVVYITPDYQGAGATTYLQIDKGTGNVNIFAANDIYMASDDVLIKEVAAPGTPASGWYAIFAKTDGILYGKNDAGVETGFGGVRPVIRPAISGTVNNWNPAGLAPGVIISPDLGGSNRIITGITAQADGAVIYMTTSVTQTITLNHLDAGSSAANQIKCPGGVDYIVTNKAGVALWYDGATTNWQFLDK